MDKDQVMDQQASQQPTGPTTPPSTTAQPQPAAKKKATEALYETLVEDGLITGSSYRAFYDALRTNADYRGLVNEELKKSGYDGFSSGDELFATYLAKDSEVEVKGVEPSEGVGGENYVAREDGQSVMRVEQTDAFRNLRSAVDPSAPTSRAERPTAPITAPFAQDLKSTLSDFTRPQATEPTANPLTATQATEPTVFSTEEAVAAIQQLDADFRERQAKVQEDAIRAAGAGQLDLGEMQSVERDQRVLSATLRNPAALIVPDINTTGATSDPATDVVLIDIQRDFQKISASPGQVRNTLESFARQYTGREMSDLSPLEKNAVIARFSDRYVTEEMANEMMDNAGLERDMSAFRNAWNASARGFTGVFVDALTAVERSMNPSEGAGTVGENSLGGEVIQGISKMGDQMSDLASTAFRNVATVFGDGDVGWSGAREGRPDAEITADNRKAKEDLARTFRLDPARASSFLQTKVPEAIGGTMMILTGTVAGTMLGGTPGAVVGGGLIGGLSAKEQGFQTAKELGASDADARKVGAAFGVLGVTESLPLLGFMKATGASKAIGAATKREIMTRFVSGVAKNTVEETAQELVVYLGQRLSTNELLGLSQEYLDKGFFETAAIAAITGGSFGMVGASVGLVKDIRNRAESIPEERYEEALRVYAQAQKVDNAIAESILPKLMSEYQAAQQGIDATIAEVDAQIAALQADANASEKQVQEAFEDKAHLNVLKTKVQEARSRAEVAGKDSAAALNEVMQNDAFFSVDANDAVTFFQERYKAREISRGATTISQANNSATETESPTQSEAETEAVSATQTVDAATTVQPNTSEIAPDPVMISKANDVELNLVSRALNEGEDSNYKPPKGQPDRNKVRRVMNPDGAVDYAIKETSRGTTLIQRNEDGKWTSKNLKTGTSTLLGANSSIVKAVERASPNRQAQQAPQAAPDAQGPAPTTQPTPDAQASTQEAPAVPDAPTTPDAPVEPSTPAAPEAQAATPVAQVTPSNEAPALATEAVPTDEAAAQAEPSTTVSKNKVTAQQKAAIEKRLPKEVAERVISDLEGTTDPNTFGEFLSSKDADTQKAYQNATKKAAPTSLANHRALANLDSQSASQTSQPTTAETTATTATAETAQSSDTNTDEEAAVDSDDDGTILGYMFSRKRPTKGKMSVAPPTKKTETKTPRKILGDVRRGVNIDLGWKKISGAFGFYNAKTRKAGISYQGDLMTAAHEIGHSIDFRYGIVNPKSGSLPANQTQINAELDIWSKLSPLARKRNATASTTQLRQEGFAHFIEAWVVNPAETSRISPELGKVMLEVLSESDRKAMVDFSNDVRTYLTDTSLSAAANNVESAIQSGRKDRTKQSSLKKAGWINATEDIKEVAGEFSKFLGWQSSIKAMWLDGMTRTFGSWDKANRLLDLEPDDRLGVRDSQGQMVGVHLKWLMTRILGRNGRFSRFVKDGIILPNGKKAVDTKGNVITFGYLLEAYDQTDPASMAKELDQAMGALGAERAVEMVARQMAGRKFIMDKLESVGVTEDMLDRKGKKPLDFARFIMSKIGEYNLANPTKKISEDQIVVSGAGQFGKSDLAVAIQQLEALENMESAGKREKASAERIREGMYRYREAARVILDYSLQSGRISNADYQTIIDNNQYYAAMQRIFEITADSDDALISNVGGFGLTRVNDVFKRAKGSALSIKSPLETLFLNLNQAISEADRNSFLAEYVAPFLEIQESSTLDTDTRESATAIVEDVSNFVEDNNGNIVYRGKTVNPKAVMADGRMLQEVFIGGESRWFLIAEPIAAELETMYRVGSGGVIAEFIKGGVRFFKNTITLAPTWLLRSTPRDIIDRAIKTETGGFGFKGYSSVASKSAQSAFESSGASQAGHIVNMMANYDQHLAFAMDQLSKNGGKGIQWGSFKPPTTKGGKWISSMGFAGKGVHRAGRYYLDFMQGAENLTRIAEFTAQIKALEKTGMTTAEATMAAAYKSRDLIDYARGGMLAMQLNQYMQFLNPAIRGVEKFARVLASAKSDKERAMIMGTKFMTMIVLPSMATNAISLLFADEEERKDWINQYVNKPAWQRYLFWNIKVGNDEWLTIPKPFEFGTIGSAIDHIFLYAITGDERFMSGMAGMFAKQFIPIAPSVLTTGTGGPLSLIFELPANYNFFQERYIVSPFDEGKDTGLLKKQAEKASSMGRGFQYVMKEFANMDVDARKVDYALQKGFGTFGKYAVELAKPNYGVRGNPNAGAEVLRRLGLLQYNPTFQSKDYQDFMTFARKTEAGQVKGPFKDVIEASRILLDQYDAAPTMEQREQMSSVFLEMVKTVAELSRDKDFVKQYVKQRALKKELNAK